MKIKLENTSYEIEIKVKRSYKDRATKEDTLHFLNLLAILANDSAELNEMKFHEPCEYRRALGEELYEICKKHGLYKD